MSGKPSRRVSRSVRSCIVAAFWTYTTISWSQQGAYDLTSTMEVSGSLFKFVLKIRGSTESRIHIAVPGGDGETEEWIVVLGNADELIAAGLSFQTFAPGEKLVVSGNPALDSNTHRILAIKITREDGSVWSR